MFRVPAEPFRSQIRIAELERRRHGNGILGGAVWLF